MPQRLHSVPVVGVALAAALTVGCGDRTPPVLRDLSVTPNPNASTPLTALITVTTDEPARVSLEIRDSDDRWQTPRLTPCSERSTTSPRSASAPPRDTRSRCWRSIRPAMKPDRSPGRS